MSIILDKEEIINKIKEKNTVKDIIENIEGIIDAKYNTVKDTFNRNTIVVRELSISNKKNKKMSFKTIDCQTSKKQTYHIISTTNGIIEVTNEAELKLFNDFVNKVMLLLKDIEKKENTELIRSHINVEVGKIQSPPPRR